MSNPQVERISSAANPTLKKLRALVQNPGAYRSEGQVWLEGDHLVRAALQRGHALPLALITEDALNERTDWRDLALQARRVLVLPPALFEALSGLPSPAQLGAVLSLPIPPVLAPSVATLVLDRLQDAGNVGAILRSAAAFGVRQVVALKGTAALWSPKVLRAGMGAHFGLALHEGATLDTLDALAVPLVATSSHAQDELPSAPLPRPCAWVMGHEGQGVADALMARCALTVRIPQPGGEESLNVAAAAAICLYESARRAQ